MNLNCEIGSPMHKAKMEYRTAIIEECARVADLYNDYDHNTISAKIATAIRALKDKP